MFEDQLAKYKKYRKVTDHCSYVGEYRVATFVI